MDITRQSKLEDPKKFRVSVFIENDCSFYDGEYSLMIHEIINGFIEEDDFELIKECIENDIDKKCLMKEIIIDITLIESGEWEDVFWHKYYKIEKVELIDPDDEEKLKAGDKVYLKDDKYGESKGVIIPMDNLSLGCICVRWSNTLAASVHFQDSLVKINEENITEK